jgi:predicted Zn-dependent protease
MINSMNNLKVILLCGAVSVAMLCPTGCAPHQKLPDGRSHVRGEESSFAAGAHRPPTAETSYAYAKVLISQGRDRDALYVLSRVAREHAEFIPAYNEMAGIYVRSDRLEDAIDVLQAALKRAPNDAVLHNNLGMCHMLRGENEEALESFTRAADAAPTVPAFRSNRAAALALTGHPAEAEKEYRTVVGGMEARQNVRVLAHARTQQQQAETEPEAPRAGGDGQSGSPAAPGADASNQPEESPTGSASSVAAAEPVTAEPASNAADGDAVLDETRLSE